MEPPSPRIRRAAKASASREGSFQKDKKKKSKTQLDQGLEIDADLEPAGSPILSNLGSKADEMGPEAIARIQKAQIRGLKNRIKFLSEQLAVAEKRGADGKDLLKEIGELNTANEKLEKRVAKETRKVLRLTQSAADGKEQEKKLRLELKAAQKDIDDLKRSLRESSSKSSTKKGSSDVRLNRALEELSQFRDEVNRLKARNRDDVDSTKEQLKRQDTHIRQLERQRAELLTAFKKQAQLIDVLKRQKMHIETAKLLSFTEEEFVKLIDEGPSGK
eukprot:g23.t1